MNLSHLYYFKKLAEVKHYTKAAQELFIAQPTLSAAISHLEKELGVPLFQRQRRSIELTDYGKDFYYYVCQGLASIEKGTDAVQERAGRVNGTLDIGMLYAMQGRNWSDAVAKFHDDVKSNVQINIHQGFSEKLIAGVRQGKYDAAFTGVKLDDPDLVQVPVWRQEFTIAVHNQSPLAARDAVNIDDIAPYHILTYREGSPCSNAVEAMFGDRDLDVDRTYTDEITLCSLVTSDPKSVAIIAYSYLVRAFTGIKLLHIEDVPENFHMVYLTYRPEISGQTTVGKFVDFIGSYNFPLAVIGSD